MFKKLCKLVPVLALGTILVGQSAFAATGSVTPGELKFDNNTTKAQLGTGSYLLSNPSAIGFGQLGEINVFTAIPEKTVNDFVRVEDNRGENSGWVLKVAASNLEAIVDDKSTTDPTDKLTVSLPVNSWFQVESTNVEALAGQTLNVNPKTTSALSTGGITILEALNGYGAGAYTADLTYTLSLPKYLTGASVTPDDTTNSKFANLSDLSHVGLFAGDYQTTVTYSITTAP